VFINLKLKEVNEDGSKWILVHEFVDDQGKKKAQLTVEILWFNIKSRRILKPLPDVLSNTAKRIINEIGV